VAARRDAPAVDEGGSMKTWQLASAAALAIGFLVGCASSGVVPTGAGTYMITKQSATGFHSGASVTADLYREAGEFCAAQKKELVRINVSEKDGVPGYAFASSQLEFRCQ
jgi:hypothetical protein